MATNHCWNTARKQHWCHIRLTGDLRAKIPLLEEGSVSMALVSMSLQHWIEMYVTRASVNKLYTSKSMFIQRLKITYCIQVGPCRMKLDRSSKHSIRQLVSLASRRPALSVFVDTCCINLPPLLGVPGFTCVVLVKRNQYMSKICLNLIIPTNAK